MSDTKWTPGPWPIEGGRTVAIPFRGKYGSALAFAGTVANANLIAAAPMLYEALSNIENDDGRIPKAIWDMRNAALAAARGES